MVREGTRPRATGGGGRGGAAIPGGGGVAGMEGWRGWWGGGAGDGRAGGAELSSIRRPEGAGATEGREGGSGRPEGVQAPDRTGRRNGGPGGSWGWRPRGWRGGGAEGGREEADDRRGVQAPGPDDRSAGGPGVPLPGAPPCGRFRLCPVIPSPVGVHPCMEQFMALARLPSPRLAAKDYTAYGGRCRRGGRRGILEPWRRSEARAEGRRRKVGAWGLGSGRGWEAGGCRAGARRGAGRVENQK